MVEWTEEQKKAYNHNLYKAIKHFEEIGELPEDRQPWEYCLHHKDPSWKYNDVDRYIAMNFDDLEVKLFSEHSRDHNLGNVLSEETRHKISESNKGKTGELNSFFGHKHTEDSKQKMSETHKESFQNGREIWNKGKTGIYSEETIKKMSDAAKNREHKPLSDETKKKCSEARKLWWAKRKAEKALNNA